ncbi:hypothetical protein IFR23_14620 [Sphingomonas sp. CFBP 13603]|uniref:hypothetical protein n=1 Tax=Sphingomonas sp. CFBP 13603 TaxID=2774040 RepID=UPI001865ED49|nr:hypothetical protein [Sphingomonas sp. CFBP 13603]MBE2993236.1 hypothetical protein [Sphingomonas sp. CFBP 13603]
MTRATVSAAPIPTAPIPAWPIPAWPITGATSSYGAIRGTGRIVFAGVARTAPTTVSHAPFELAPREMTG